LDDFKLTLLFLQILTNVCSTQFHTNNCSGLPVAKREGWLLRMLQSLFFCDICFDCAEMKTQEFSNKE